jgi:hydrogenase nickel incorporation protein HypB
VEIKIVKQVLQWNEDCNDELKGFFREKKVFVINIMGSPGAGKTSLIMNIINNLRQNFKIAVIEADIAGKIDAEKIDSIGIPVVQLHTEGACHIEAMSIKNIISNFDIDDTDIIIIENIGNLVCPAEFNIGEDLKIALLSVPEGDDKVIKYPLMFSTSDCVVINKFDMKGYFNFDYDRVFSDARNANPDIAVFPVSSVTGAGVSEFIKWLEGRAALKLR